MNVNKIFTVRHYFFIHIRMDVVGVMASFLLSKKKGRRLLARHGVAWRGADAEQTSFCSHSLLQLCVAN